MCNECGNCAVFCPYDGRPYKDKLTLFGSAEDMKDSENEGFLPLAGGRVCVRYDAQEFEMDPAKGDSRLPEDVRAIICAVIKDHAYMIK
jgi:putative selenate reductase